MSFPNKDTETGSDDNNHAAETTSLIPPSAVASLDGSSEGSQLLADEAERPWPATFERSIGLLSSPVISADRVDVITKSPKPGATPLFGGKSRNNLWRGYNTPDGPLMPNRSSSIGGQEFSQLQKVQSLDFKSKTNHLAIASKTQRQQEQRQAEAQAYRQKLLAKNNKRKKPQLVQQNESMSPGYYREQTIDRNTRKKKANEAKAKGQKATFSQCVFNMSNILMGVGMLGLPYVMRSAGWIGGTCVLCFFAFVCWRTSILIGRELNGDPRPSHYFDDSPFKSPLVPGSAPEARVRAPITSFPQIARESFGETGNVFLSLVLYFELFSCLCIFIVTISDHLQSLYPTVSKDVFAVAVSVVLTVPTILLHTPRLLSYLSMVGTVATICVVLAVTFSALIEGDISERVAEEKGEEETHRILFDPSGLALGLGLVAYCFSGHAIVPSIYSSMEKPQEFEMMINYTFLIVLASCAAVGLSGYYMFGSVVDDQITISLEESSPASANLAMKGLTWLMILTAVSKFTLSMFPLALGIEEIVAPYLPDENAMTAASSIIKVTLIALSLLVALFVPSFSYLCALVGMVCTMVVSVIFPAAAHLKFFHEQLSIGEKLLDWLFVVIGSVVAVVGTIATV